MNLGAFFFVLCAVLALVGALGVVMAQSPIRSALGLLVTVLGVAGLFLMLHAELLAAIQLIVYAGAVVVLFVFVIMVVGPVPGTRGVADRSRVARVIGGGLMFVFSGLLLGLLAAGAQPGPLPVVRAGYGTVEAVGQRLFSQGLVPFELVTVLLLAAVVGALALVRGRPAEPAAPEAPAEDASARLFGGPVPPPSPRKPAA